MTVRNKTTDEGWQALRDELEAIETDTDGDELEDNTKDERLAELYRSAGFESCYHGDGNRWHYNVKLVGSGRWQGFRDKQNEREARNNGFDSKRFEAIAQQLEDDNAEVWWQDSVQNASQEAYWDATEDELWRGQNPTDGATPRRDTYYHPRVYSCGRSAGYVNSTELEAQPDGMLRFAEWLENEDIYNNATEAGAYLADEALELYDAALLRELASPRVDMVWL